MPSGFFAPLSTRFATAAICEGAMSCKRLKTTSSVCSAAI